MELAKTKMATEKAAGPKPGSGRDRVQYSIRGEPQLRLLVYASGERRFQFRAKVRTNEKHPNGRPRYRTETTSLGRYPDVSLEDVWHAAAELRRNLQIHGTTRIAPAEPSRSFADLTEAWLAHCRLTCRHSTLTRYELIVSRYLLPRFRYSQRRLLSQKGR